MSNLKNLKKTLKSISEKKDPILNMYLGNSAHLGLIEEENEMYINALLNPGIAKITTREIGKPNFLGQTDYEIIIKKNSNGNRLDIVIYNPNEQKACSSTLIREDGFITKVNTSFELDANVVTCIQSKTDIYDRSTLALIDDRYNYDEEPISVIYGIMRSKEEKMNSIEPDYSDSFASWLEENAEGEFINKTETKGNDNEFETEAYSLLPNRESVLTAYNEYINGELRSSTFDLNKTRNK